jgi:dUTP pyrophosphatase
MKTVIITGVTGQDGSLMADYLLKNTDYNILGAVRRLSVSNHQNISHISDPRFKLIDLDISDPQSTNHVIDTYRPDYFINFAGMLTPSITIPVINRSAFLLPAYATVGSSGLDVRANIDEPITLQSLERTLVPTGLFVEIPLGFEIQVRPRSGLAVKQGLTCLNTPGTIDADYRGEIKVILINLSQEPQIIQPGDRIAQLVLQAIELIEWKPVDQLNETDRGSGGFGHTGKQ